MFSLQINSHTHLLDGTQHFFLLFGCKIFKSEEKGSFKRMGNCSSTKQTIIIHTPQHYPLPSRINNIDHTFHENYPVEVEDNQDENFEEEKNSHSSKTFGSVPNISLTLEIQSEHDIVILDNYLQTEITFKNQHSSTSSTYLQYQQGQQDNDSISGVISTISSLTSHSGSTKRSGENPAADQLRTSPPFPKNSAAAGPKTPESIRASRSLFTPYKSQFSSSTLAYNTIDEHTLHSSS